MSATEAAAGAALPRALCVSVHDVAPATWDDCQRLRDTVREVADIALTWLVVPRYHGDAARSPVLEAALDQALARGDELALHGFTHRDTAAAGASLVARWQRTVYTRGEGEFAALSARQARLRLMLGLAWFRARGWPVAGFVAPAWLLGPGARQALAETSFLYTTTLCRFVCLPDGPALWSPSLVYTARNGPGRWLSPPALRMLAAAQAQAPLVRLSLHPADARHPALLRHLRHLLPRLLAQREALTKDGFARRLTSTAPTPRRHTSDAARSPRSTTDSRRSGSAPPWC